MKLTITDEKSKKASDGAPSPVMPSSLRYQIHQKRVTLADGQGTYLSFGMLMKEAGQVTTVPGEGFGRRLKASGVVPLTSL